MIVFYFISRYLFDNVCPILLFKPYDMMPYSHLPSQVYLFCTLTHGCTCPPILLLLKYFTPYYFNNFTLSILASFHLANIHNYFCIARKDCPSLLPLCYFPHTVSYISTGINPFLLHLFLPSADRYPTVIRSFSVLQSDNGPLIGRMR